MSLTKLQFQPGVNRETTGYANEGGWWDIDKVRFRAGFPEKIGGWQKSTTAAFLGTCRAIHPWVALDTNQYIGFGTSQKYYVLASGLYNDITPIRATTAAGDLTFSVPYTTLNGGITASAVTITLTSTAGFPTIGGTIKIDSEVIAYSGVSGSTLTGCVRGQDGTTAASHLTSAPVLCSTITVTDASHGAYENDFVTVSGASSLGGNITAAILNQEYQVAGVINGNSYTIEARAVSSIQSVTVTGGTSFTRVFSSASDTGSGGASTVGAYQINSGLDTSVFGTGWGAGTWGRGGWGSASSVSVSGAQLRLWGHDNYGEDLIFNVRDGGVYFWDKSTAYPRAVALSSVSGANKAPTVARQVMVSDNDRHVIAFGCDDEFATGVQDPLLIRFSAQEDYTDWETRPTSTAGSLRIGTGSGFVQAVEMKQQILIFTDVSIHAMQYLGPPFTFGLTMVSDNVSIISSNAAVSVDDAVFWMGEGEFYTYNGIATAMPCDVKDYIFSNMNQSQTAKVVAGANINYGEVWWFYPSSSSQENDSYVVFNYQQKLWYYGTMARTAWTHKNEGINPIAASPDNFSYLHEVGTDDGSTNPPSGITAYVESSGQDLGDGDQFAYIWRIIPDLTFRNSTGTPMVDFTVKTSNFPGGNFTEEVPSSVVRTATYPVEQFTNQLYVRLRGRSFAFRIESTETGVAWRLGMPRLDVRTDGRR